MRGNLNDHICRWQVDRSVADFANEDGVYRVIFLEVLQDVHALQLIRAAVNKWSFQRFREVLLGVD